MTWPLDRGLTRVALIFLAIAVVCAVHFDTVSAMVSMWDQEHHTQSYLVPPLFLYLLWSVRHSLAAAPAGGGWLGVAAAVALTMLWIVTDAIALQIGVFVSVVLLMSALSLAVLGWPAYRTVWFPLAFLLASVPAGSEFIPQLMNFAADISEVLLRLTGVPFYRQGKIFQLPGGNFEVAEVCAGLRYLSAAVTLAVLYSYLTFRSFWRWVVFIGITIVAFIFANGLRATITMWVSSETAWHDFTGPGHVWMGRILFLVVILGMFWFGKHFSDLPPEEPRPAPGPGEQRTRVALGSGLAALLIVILAPIAHGMRGHSASNADFLATAPDVVGCTHLDGWPASWTPTFMGADHVLQAGYDCDGVVVGLYVATYQTQAQGKEMVTEGNRVLPPGKNQIADTGIARFTTPTGRQVPVNTLKFTTTDAAGLGWSWYAVGSAPERSGLMVKLREVGDALLFRQSLAAAYVVLAMDNSTSPRDLQPVVERVAQSAWASRAE